MPVPSPPQGKKIWGDSVMESPLDLFKWGDKPPLCVRLCSLKLLSATNGDYDGDKFCDLTHQLHTHSCLTARRRSPEGADIWRRVSQCIQNQSHQEDWLLSQRNAKQLSVFNITLGLSCFSLDYSIITFESSCSSDDQEKNIHQLVVNVFWSIISVSDKFRMQWKCHCKVGSSFKHG